MEKILNFEYKKGKVQVFPNHPMVKNWLFSEEEEEEAALACCIAAVAEKNGIGVNDLSHLFPAILRMLKNTSEWTE